jgi:hypothetical protein
VAHYKIFIFALAAMLSGLAGMLYVPQVGIITPSQIGVLPSLEIVVWVATGGRGTLIGAILGAVGINAARSVLTARYPEWWPIVLGGLFVGVVMLFPDGLAGLPANSNAGAPAAMATPHACAHPTVRCQSQSEESTVVWNRDHPKVWRHSMTQHGSIVYLEGVSVTFDGFQALRGVNLYVEHGELRALIGPNGAGKTTLLDVICGQVKPDTGRVISATRPI